MVHGGPHGMAKTCRSLGRLVAGALGRVARLGTSGLEREVGTLKRKETTHDEEYRKKLRFEQVCACFVYLGCCRL